jgi:very-short-patch-repair endonuclease
MPRHCIPSEQRSFAKGLRKNQTALEDRVWHELRAKRLDGWKFKRQVPIKGYIADFVCFERRLIVEVDGPLHHTPEQRRKDISRDAVLRRCGFRTLRFDDEAALGRVIDNVRQALQDPPLPAVG